MADVLEASFMPFTLIFFYLFHIRSVTNFFMYQYLWLSGTPNSDGRNLILDAPGLLVSS